MKLFFSKETHKLIKYVIIRHANNKFFNHYPKRKIQIIQKL